MFGLQRRASLVGVAIATVAAAAGLVGAAPPTTGAAGSPDLIDVVRVGTGTAALTSAATATFVVPMLSTGTVGSPIALPTAASGSQKPFASSGTASSEGALERSQDGNCLTLLGYAATPGTTGVNGGDSINDTASTSVPRVIARISGSGAVDTSTALTDAFAGSNARGAVSSDCTHFWATGDGGGNGATSGTVITGTNASIVYASGLGVTTSTALVTSPKQSRVPVIAGGNLYYSTSKTTPGIVQIGTGLPTTTATPVLKTPATTGADPGKDSDPYGFLLLAVGGSSPDTLYVADNAGNGGSFTPSLQKFTLSGSTWVSKGSIAAPSASSGLGSLTGQVESGAVQLYATTNDGSKVLALTDSSGFGNTITGSFTTVATAPTNTVYRGVAFAPTGQTLSAVPPTITLADTALSRSIGDSYDPTQTTATISDPVYSASQLTVTATSDNPSVVPTVAVTGIGSTRAVTVTSNDVVGLANITVTVTNPDGLSASAGLQYGVSAAAPDTTSNFLYDFANASTAIDAGGGYYLVGDDEFNQIALYQAGVSGPPVQTWNFDSLMGVADTSQIDIEASARLGNTIYWFGSEGNNSSGAVKPNRAILFATTIGGSGASTTLSFLGYYQNMRNDLLAWDQANGNQFGFVAGAANNQIPKEVNGFNIEGAEFAAGGSGTLYLGFRAPIVPTSNRTQALVVPVTNLASLISSSGTIGSATFGSPFFWNLTPAGYVNPLGDTSALGVREIRKNADDQYLIIAGSYEGVTPAPAGGAEYLYTWDGNVAHQPVLTNTVLPTPDDGSWETIVSVPDPLTNGSSILMLADDGDNDLYNTGVAAKDMTTAESPLLKDRSDVFSVALPSQTVVFTSTPPSPAYSGTTYSVSATGGASGNAVVFSIDPSTPAGVCSVTGEQVHLLGAGNCTVDADQAGTFQYTAGHASQSVSVVSPPPPAVTVPADQTVETATSTGALVTFAASATDVFDSTDPVNCAPLSGSLFPPGLTTVTCSATDSHGILGTASFTVNVRVRPDHFRVSFTATSVATGAGFPVTITALDAANHTLTAYQGGATLTDTSGSLSVLGSISWSGGVGTATVSVGTAIARDRLTATDASFTVPPMGTSTNVLSVTGATLDHFHFSGLPTTFSTGDQVTFQVAALDAGSQVITGFSGPLVLSDATGTLNVVSVSWLNGVATVTISVGTATTRDRVTVVSDAVSAQSVVFNVLGPVVSLRVTVSPATTVTQGSTATVTVTAVDSAGQVVTGFAGSVALTDTSGAMVLLSPPTWLAGVGTVDVEFPTVIARDRVTANDGDGHSGQSAVFAVTQILAL